MALFTTKTWKNRKSEYPGRRTLTLEDGAQKLVSVSRAEGNITEEGDAFSAENMNDLEARILTALNALEPSLVTVRLADIGVSGKTGVKASLSMNRIGSRATITIRYQITSNTKDSASYTFLDMEKLKTALGLTALSFPVDATAVILLPVITVTGSEANLITSYGSAEKLGTTGLMLTESGQLARIYKDDGTYGAWTLSCGLFTPDTFGLILINGATVE